MNVCHALDQNYFSVKLSSTVLSHIFSKEKEEKKEKMKKQEKKNSETYYARTN